MYVAVNTLGRAKSGEMLIIEQDTRFGGISVKEVGGKTVGYVSETQPDGCVDYETVCVAAVGRRILGTAAVALDGILIVSSDSPSLNNIRYERVEIGGYGLIRRI